MNIRIGNDITLNITLSAGELLGRTVLGANAYLIHNISELNVLSSKSDILSDYMIHGCGAPHYFGGVGAYPHDRGFNVCGHGCTHRNHLKKYPLHVDILSNTQLRCKFLKESQNSLGDYRLVVDVTVKDCCCRKVCTYDFGEVFCLTSDEGDCSGDVILNIPNGGYNGLPIIITTQAQYDEWLEQGQIQRGTFYYIYDEIDIPDDPDNPDPDNPDQPDDPDAPTPTGDEIGRAHV